MPQPHVTLRKKEWQQALNETLNETLNDRDQMNQSHTSSFRQTQDPMAQTLQKWRESIADDDAAYSRRSSLGAQGIADDDA